MNGLHDCAAEGGDKRRCYDLEEKIERSKNPKNGGNSKAKSWIGMEKELCCLAEGLPTSRRIYCSKRMYLSNPEYSY